MENTTINQTENNAKKAAACALAALLAGSTAVPATAAFADEPPAAEPLSEEHDGSARSAIDAGTADYVKDENVYGVLDASGAPEELFVVNQFDVRSAGVVTDFGSYDRVENLTDTSAIACTDSEQVFEVPEGMFYYQGTIEGGELPWNVNVAYTLDGNEVAPDQLAGANGRVGVHIATTRNESADATFYDNYLLQVSMSVPTDRCQNIDTREAGIVSDAGEKRQVTYTVMPGKDGDLTFEADANGFEMSAIQIAGAPFSMAMDDFDTGALVDGMQQLADGTAQLDDGAGQLAGGAQQLAGGADQLSDGTSEFAKGAGKLASGTADLSDGLSKLSDGAASTAAASSQTAKGLASLSGASESVNGAAARSASEAQKLADAIAGIDTSKMSDKDAAAIEALASQATGAAKAAAGASEATEGYTSSVDEIAAGFARLDGGIQSLAKGVGDVSGGAEDLAKGTSDLADGASGLATGTSKLADGVGKLASGTSRYASGMGEFASGAAELPTKMQEEMDAALAAYQGNFEPVSFVSPGNDAIETVQFVLTTKAIEVPDEEIPVEEEPDPGFVERLVALFVKPAQ